MMTFIDLLGSDVWTDTDITNRTESILRARWSLTDEAVMNRKISGSAIGAYVLTEADQAEIAAFAEASLASQALGVEARKDMALLQGALDYEAGLVTEPSAEVLALVELRNNSLGTSENTPEPTTDLESEE